MTNFVVICISTPPFPRRGIFTCCRSKNFQSAPQSFSVYACNLVLSAFSNPVISSLISVVPDTVITVKAGAIGFPGTMVKAVYVICAMVANAATAWRCVFALVYLFRDQPQFFKCYLVIHIFSGFSHRSNSITQT